MIILRCAALALGAVLALDAAAVGRYDAKDLGQPPGDLPVVHGLNASGQVVGETLQWNSPVTHAFATGPDGVDLGDPCPADLVVTACSAMGIDDAGHVALLLRDFAGDGAETDRSGLVAIDGSGFRPLGNLGGARRLTEVYAESHRGLLTGDSRNTRGRVQAFVGRVPGRRLQPVRPLGDWHYCTGFGVNDAGQVVGFCPQLDANLTTRAFLALPDGSPVQDLGTLGGIADAALAISNNGSIVGYSYTPQDRQHATLARVGVPGLQDIGLLIAGDSLAEGVNDAGTVVGSFVADDGLYHAFVYESRDGSIAELGTLTTLPAGVFLTDARAVNERGQIAVAGSDRHVYLLTPR